MGTEELSLRSQKESELQQEVTRLSTQNEHLKTSLRHIKEMTINRSRSKEFNKRRMAQEQKDRQEEIEQLRKRLKERDQQIEDLTRTNRMLTTRLDSIRRVATGSTVIDISAQSQFCPIARKKVVDRKVDNDSVEKNNGEEQDNVYSDDTISSDDDEKESNIDKMHRAAWKRKYGDDVPYVPLPRNTEVPGWKIVPGSTFKIIKRTEQDFDDSDEDED
jgi:predicted RNase H-like nuclease (RuvC/YqgF family)